MRKKVITNDCSSCDYMKINHKEQMTCSWGTGNTIKILETQKGKKPLTCNLKK